MTPKNNNALETYKGDTESILRGYRSDVKFGKGSRTIVSEGKRFNLGSYDGRVGAYVAICKERGKSVDYGAVADFVEESKYLARNKERQYGVFDKVISASAEDGVKESYWSARFRGDVLGEIGNDFDLDGYISGLESVNLPSSGGLEDAVAGVPVAVIDDSHERKPATGRGYLSRFAALAVAGAVFAGAVLSPAPLKSAETSRNKSYGYQATAQMTPAAKDAFCDKKKKALTPCNGSIGPECNVAPKKNCNTPATEEKLGYVIYTVQKGDMTSVLARDSGVSLDNFMEVNGDFIANPDWIFPGDRVYVPISVGVDAEKGPVIKADKKKIAPKKDRVSKTYVVGNGEDALASGNKDVCDPNGDMRFIAKGKDPRAGWYDWTKNAEVKLNPIWSGWDDILRLKDKYLEGKDGLVSTAEIVDLENKVGSGWTSYYYEDMKRRSPVLDKNGRVDPSAERFGAAIAKNYEGLNKELSSSDDLGYAEGKTTKRFDSMGNRVVSFGKNLVNFISLGTLCEPDHLKKRREAGNPSDRFLTALGAPVRMVTGDALGLVTDVVDVPTGGLASKTLRVVGDGVVGTTGTVLDTATTLVGSTVGLAAQTVEEELYGNSYVTKTFNGGVGIATRFTENVINLEAMENGSLSEDGDNKGVIGSFAEQIATYALIGAAADDDGSSKKRGTKKPEKITPVENVVVEDIGNWGRVGR